MIVAVDGPSGAGKSSVCREVARRLGFVLVDTGALYRAVALMATRRGLATDDAEGLGQMARELTLRFERQGDAQRLLCDGADISADVRTQEVGRAASEVSVHPPVRAALLDAQRQAGRATDAIIEGRDIGTVVFPDADLKVFYVASLEARTARRLRELLERGAEADAETVRLEIERRDARDRSRAVSPLKKADDAVLLDTSTLDFEAACGALIALIEARRARTARPPD